jgi:hypothetical protein
MSNNFQNQNKTKSSFISDSIESQRKRQGQNVFESLKDISSVTSKNLVNELFKETPQDMARQIFGPVKQRRFSGEIEPGESLLVSEVLSGEREEKEKLKKQLVLERKIRSEEKARIEKEANELKLQLHAVTQEITKIAQNTPELAQQVRIASMQAPVEPGIYHIVFFEKLLEFLKSFRKKIQEASIWLNAVNKRASKKNYWARYKQYKGKFLLSGEHYLTRSAG